MNKKKIIIIAVVLVLGILAMIGSYIMIQQNNRIASETKKMVVLNKKVTPYETITAEDLKYVDILKDVDVEGYLVKKDDIIGNIVTTELTTDDWIKEDVIVNEDKLNNLAFITIKTDYTKSCGAKPGNVVDVYHSQVSRIEGEEIISEELVAKNVVVVNITNSNGESIYEDANTSGIPLASKVTPVEAIKIAFDSSEVDVKKLLEGSINPENRYVVVVKNEESSIKLSK